MRTVFQMIAGGLLLAATTVPAQGGQAGAAPERRFIHHVLMGWPAPCPRHRI